MVVVDYEMPIDPSSSSTPFISALNSQVVRAGSFRCDCRGIGSLGGCGEVVVTSPSSLNSTHAVSAIRSFKGTAGTDNDNYLPRPVNGRATVAAVFDIKTDAISILYLSDFNYTQTQLQRSIIDGYLNAPATYIPFDASD